MLVVRAVTRPKFRGMPMKRADEGSGLLPWSWAEQRLERARNYWLSTTRPDGSPHAMPLWGIWLDGAVLFDTHPLSQKVRNLEHDPRAVVHLEGGEEAVILEGTVEVHEDPEAGLLDRFVRAYKEKYDWESDGAFVFTPRIAYAWLNSDFAGSATRYAFEAQ